MAAYYNEIDPYAAQWLRNLIAAGHIAPGDVDERSINDVKADDLRKYTQCHFFAGIGVWSYALRRAGWSDDRPVWTGSCPCQPFSAAGKQQGTADERHLWPVWFDLIRQCKPAVVFGEQVEAAIRHGWLDLVQADMEGINYAFAAAGIPAAGVGAPHIRQRLWFVADADQQQWDRSGNAGSGRRGEPAVLGTTGRLGNNNNTGLEGQRGGHQAEGGRHGAVRSAASASESGGMAKPDRRELNGLAEFRGAECDRQDTGRTQGRGGAAACGNDGRMADAKSTQFHGGSSVVKSQIVKERDQRGGSGATGGLADTEHAGHRGSQADATEQSGDGQGNGVSDRGAGELRGARPGPTNGHWQDADWLHCRDGKWRPVEPGTFPLAHGAAARVGRLRAYGNAIVPQVAAEVISAYMLG